MEVVPGTLARNCVGNGSPSTGTGSSPSMSMIAGRARRRSSSTVRFAFPSRQKPRRAAWAKPVSSARAGTRLETVPPPLEAGERLILHFGAVDYLAAVWGQRPTSCRARGGVYTVLRRHHRCRRGRSHGDRCPGAGRPARFGQAARQAGLAAAAALHLVSAHDGHLADRLAGESAAGPGSAASSGLPRWTATKSGSKPSCTVRGAMICGCGSRSAPARFCSSTIPTR